MNSIYLHQGTPDRPAVFFRTDSVQMAKRLVGLLEKKFPEYVGVFAARPVQGHDEEILFDEQLGFVEQTAQIADAIFGELPSDVSAEQKELVERYRDCQRWQGIFRDQELKKRPPTGPFYVVANWWEEGYSGSSPVFRAESAAIADELASAANTKFATDPQEAQELGSAVLYEVVPADAVPSRIVWDEELQRLEEEVRLGKTDCNAEVHISCTKWEATLRAGKSVIKTNLPKTNAVADVAKAADTFLAGIADFVKCVTTTGDRRDPETIYLPLEEAGYVLLRSGRDWSLTVDLLDRLLRVARTEGIPHDGFANRCDSYLDNPPHSVHRYLTALKGEVYAVRHEALLRLPAGGTVAERPTAPRSNTSPTDISKGVDDLVTLDEAAAMAHRSKKTLERYLSKMPRPHVQGGGGKPSLWKWDEIRPWLEQEFVPDLPLRFPRNVR